MNLPIRLMFVLTPPQAVIRPANATATARPLKGLNGTYLTGRDGAVLWGR